MAKKPRMFVTTHDEMDEEMIDSLEHDLDKPWTISEQEMPPKAQYTLVSAAFMYFVLSDKLDEKKRTSGLMSEDELVLVKRLGNWWRQLGHEKRQALYEMAFRASQSFVPTTEKYFD